MQSYIQSVQYLPVSLTKEDMVEISVPKYDRFIVEPEHPSYTDAKISFSQNKYKYPYLPLCVGPSEVANAVELNVLRLMIRDNNENAPIYLPKQLRCLQDFILENINYHRQFYKANKDAFVYLTVRSCTFDEMYYKNSFGWHIDGFQGARVKRHLIEQNAFWCNTSPTDFSLQPYFCEHLNCALYDINDFFNSQADERFLIKTLEKHTYFVNPYNVHRVCPTRFEGNRLFIRLNFSPVLIEDYTNTENPMLAQYRFKTRRDVRDFLRTYRMDERKNSGFNWRNE